MPHLHLQNVLMKNREFFNLAFCKLSPLEYYHADRKTEAIGIICFAAEGLQYVGRFAKPI